MSARTKNLLTVLSVLLCTCYVLGKDPTTSLDAFADSLAEPWQAVLVFVVLPFKLLFSFGFMIGTALLGVLAWLRFGKAIPTVCRFQPLVLPLLSMLWAAVQATPFLRVPAGQPIRPMAWTFYVSLSALVLTALSITSTISASKKGANRVVCLIALVLSLTVLVLPPLSLHAVAIIRGFTLAP